jgi:hypothetical protein
MISERPATNCPRATLATPGLLVRLADTRGHLPGISGRKGLQVVSEPNGTLALWRTVWLGIAWVTLIIIINVALGRVLQLAAENFASRAAASEPAQPIDAEYARGACPVLDRYVHRAISIDELHDLRDQLCPTLSEPRQRGTDSDRA